MLPYDSELTLSSKPFASGSELTSTRQLNSERLSCSARASLTVSTMSCFPIPVTFMACLRASSPLPTEIVRPKCSTSWQSRQTTSYPTSLCTCELSSNPHFSLTSSPMDDPQIWHLFPDSLSALGRILSNHIDLKSGSTRARCASDLFQEGPGIRSIWNGPRRTNSHHWPPSAFHPNKCEI